MGLFPGFVGPSYVSQSPLVNGERCINLYPEVIEAQAAKSRYALYPTPGLTEFAQLATTPLRGMFSQDGRAFVVGGGVPYELSSAGVATALGTIVTNNRPVTMCSNGDGGSQLLINSDGRAYIYNLTTAAFTNPLTSGAHFGGYLDSFFLALDTDTSTLQVSDANDGTTWDPTQIFQRGTNSDRWRSMLVRKPDIWLFGSASSDVFYNAGTSFPFLPRPDAIIQYGIAADYSAAVVDSAPTWLGQTLDGGGVVLQAQGYTPKRISTHAVEYAIQRYSRIDDAIGFTYQEYGHTFYVLSFPTAGVTWVYDAFTQFWHERGYWNVSRGAFEAWRPICHMQAFGRHLVGDRVTGAIYAMSSDTATDVDGNGIRRLRRAPHLSDQGEFLFHDSFQVDLEAGLGLQTGQGSDPQLMLHWSNDGGKTFGNEHWTSAGMVGQYGSRAMWQRLGRARDRVYELTYSEPVPLRVTQAFLETSGGTA